MIIEINHSNGPKNHLTSHNNFIMEQNAMFRSQSNNYSPIPIKPKVYLFSETSSTFKRKIHNPQRVVQSQILGFNDSLHEISIKKSWKPKIPNKRLFQDPKFFISLQKKKYRIINGIRNSSRMPMQQQLEHGNQFKGGKVKSSSSFAIHRTKKSQEEDFQKYMIVSDKSAQPKNKKNRTPYLNFNMQYLIKKRKSLVGFGGLSKIGSFSSQLQVGTSQQQRAKSHAIKVKTIDCSYLGSGRI